LQEAISQAANESDRNALKSLIGRIAIANAKLAYQQYKHVFHGARFAALKAAGAQVQRPLWASTSTKNPTYSDVYYVEALIGPETVDTIPPATLAAFRDHGVAKVTIEDNLDQERARLAELESFGISLNEVTEQVLLDGVRLFVEPFEKLLKSIEAKRDEISSRKSQSETAD
jgi:transaldolase